MSAYQKILQTFRDYSPYILWLAGVFVILLNMWAYSKLAPIDKNLTVMAAKINNIEDQLERVEDQHMNFVERDTFELLVERINHISSRVDQIYSLILRKD